MVGWYGNEVNGKGDIMNEWPPEQTRDKRLLGTSRETEDELEG